MPTLQAGAPYRWISPRPFAFRPEDPPDLCAFFDPDTEKVHAYVEGVWKTFQPANLVTGSTLADEKLVNLARLNLEDEDVRALLVKTLLARLTWVEARVEPHWVEPTHIGKVGEIAMFRVSYGPWDEEHQYTVSSLLPPYHKDKAQWVKTVDEGKELARVLWEDWLKSALEVPAGVPL